MAHQDGVLNPYSRSLSEQAERKAAIEDLRSMRGSFRELYDRFGGVKEVVRDRHGIEAPDEEG